MDLQDDVLLMMAKERIADAERHAALRRAIRRNQPRISARMRLGRLFIRIGQAMLGDGSVPRYQASVQP
jgi:hypothetical protein